MVQMTLVNPKSSKLHPKTQINKQINKTNVLQKGLRMTVSGPCVISRGQLYVNYLM